MKRYRVFRYEFDSRARTLGLEINPNWDAIVRVQWEENQANIRAELAAEFGEQEAAAKAANFIEIGSRPFSVLGFHNRFAAQARRAFVIGAYYPALTATCALGERILNHLILNLREAYKSTTEYKKVYKKDSFDQWNVAILTLESWGCCSPPPSAHSARWKQSEIEPFTFIRKQITTIAL